MNCLLAIDPGREKCGLAVLEAGQALRMEIVPREGVVQAVVGICSAHPVGLIIVGNGTGGAALADEIRSARTDFAVELVDETLTSRRARTRFFEDNPPRGLLRLVPRGLLTPPRPYDDYTALIIAEDYLRRRS